MNYDDLLKSLREIDPRLTDKVPEPEPTFVRDQERIGNPFRDQIVVYLIQHGWRRCDCPKHGWIKINRNIRICQPAAMAYAAEKSR